jgi:hypothetical protein
MERLSVGFQSLQFEDLNESDRVLRGGVMAMEGDFIDGRGSFGRESLQQISKMANNVPKGLKSRFGHPSFLADGLGRFLGRWRATRMGTALNREGKRVNAVRGDLALDASSFDTPFGDLGGYVLKLAASDSDAISSSLVISPKEEHRDKGQPPLWYPEQLWASDIVEEGAAVAGLLGSVEAIRGKLHELLDRAFDDETREVMEAFWSSYLDRKFGEQPAAEPTPMLTARIEQMQERAITMRKLASPPKR